MDGEIRLTTNNLLSSESASGLSWWKENLVKPALNTAVLEPWHAVAHAVNGASTSVGGSELFDEKVTYKIKEARLWSPEWFTQNLSSGLAMVVPYGLAAVGSKTILTGVGSRLGATGLTADVLKHRTTSMVVGAAAYDGFRVPKENETRLGNAAAGAAGFLVFEAGNGLAQMKKLSGGSLLLARAGTGVLGASTQLTVSRGIAKGELPELKEYYAAAASGMTMNLVLPKVHEGIEKAALHGRDAMGMSLPADYWLQSRLANHPDASPTLKQLMSDQPWVKVKDTTGPSEIQLGSGQILINKADASAPRLAYALSHQNSFQQAKPTMLEAANLMKNGDTAGGLRLFTEMRIAAELRAVEAQRAVARELGLKPAEPGSPLAGTGEAPMQTTLPGRLRVPAGTTEGAKLEPTGDKKGASLTESVKGATEQSTRPADLADLRARIEQGKVPSTDYPSHPKFPNEPLPFQSEVTPLPRLKPGTTEVEYVPTPVRKYKVPGEREAFVIIPEEYAARLERYAELKAQAAESGARGDHARAELARPENAALAGRLTPSEAVRYMADLPDGRNLSEFVLHDNKSPFNEKLRAKHGDQTLEATLDSEIGKNRSNAYERQRDAIMMEDMLHEWAHHFEKSRPFEAALYTLAAEFEAKGWKDRKYATDRQENWAVCLGEYLLHPDGSRVLKLASEAPLRAAVLGEAMLSMLTALPENQRSRHHDVYVQRAKLLQQEVLPVARQMLMDKVAANPGSAEALNAIKMLAYLGEPKQLAGLKNGPAVVDLSYFPLSNREMNQLGGMRFLRELDISGTQATTDGVRALGQLPLAKLELRGLQFHDYGVQGLPKTLRELSLADTRVTDAAVPSLLTLKDLKVLDVSGTKLTPDGVRRLTEGLPLTRIFD